MNQRSTDAADEIDATILDDYRVKQYWDGEGITGTYFAEADVGGLGYSGFAYDVYYVFGPEAEWADNPERPVGARVPVISYVDELLTDIRSQL